MLCGPTVRRLRRRREEEAEHQRRVRRHARRELRSGSSPGAQLPLILPRRLAAIPRAAPSAPPFPLRMAEVLQLHQVADVAVLNGQIVQIAWQRTGPRVPGAGVRGCRRQVRAGGQLAECLPALIARKRVELKSWVEAYGLEWKGVEELQDPPAAREQVEQFVCRRLIPRLSGRIGEVAALETPPVRETVEDCVFPHLERNFAFLDRHWYALTPFWGETRPGQFHLRLGERQFLGTRTEPRAKALARYDALLQDAVRQALSSESRAAEQVLYSDAVHAVRRSARGVYYLCQRIPPYAVEGPDRKLYYFDAVEIGAPILGATAAQIIQPYLVQVMHAYRHMFVHCSTAPDLICMPRPSGYFAALRRLPVEEGLLELLESARMTLCAGYAPESTPHHQIAALGRRIIGRDEAVRQQLPIYAYYRGSKN